MIPLCTQEVDTPVMDGVHSGRVRSILFYIGANPALLLPKLFSKKFSYLMLRHLMRSWNLNIRNSQIWVSRKWKELLKWNKHFSDFHKCSLLHHQLSQAQENDKKQNCYISHVVTEMFLVWQFRLVENSCLC